MTAISEYAPSLVVNAAGYTKVDDAEIEREAAERANVTGPGVLAKACERANVTLLHVSSDYVFDGSKRGPYVESDPAAPLGFYGSTKVRGEEAVRAETNQHIILRVSWLYGAYGNNFLKTMLRLAGERDEIAVVADQYGSPTSTRDLANAVLRVVDSGSVLPFGTYHYAGDGVTTWHGFASRVLAKLSVLTGRNVHVRAITTADYPTRAKRPANSVLDCGKFERVFGFRGAPWEMEADEVVELLVRRRNCSEALEGTANA